MSSKLYRAGKAEGAQTLELRSVGAPVAHRTSVAHPASIPDADAQARLKAAWQEGYAAGEASSVQHVAERTAPVVAGLNSLLQGLASLRPGLRADAEEDTVKLAVAIARRLLHRELATDPEAILGVVKAAMNKLNLKETHRLRISAADVPLLAEVRSRLELPAQVEIVADNGLLAGSVIFETSRGDLDASVGTQLGEIERGFADLMRRA
jgi:flagellar assembly protein FliH